MSNPRDENELLVVEDRVHDPVIADPDSVVVPSGELDGTRRARILGERIDRSGDPLPERRLQLAVGARGRRMKPYLYSRTSAQGTAASRSSRACSAARLSSR